MASLQRRAADPRIIILLLAGSLICLSQLPRPTSPVDSLRPAPIIFWLNLAKGQGAFYQTGPGNDWPAVYRQLGLTPPRNTVVASWPPANFSAYRLRSHQLPKPMPFPPQASPLAFQPIPVNSVSAEILTIIPGIGPNLAAEIVHYRQKHGSIKGIADLQKIRGIGGRKSEIIAGFVSF